MYITKRHIEYKFSGLTPVKYIKISFDVIWFMFFSFCIEKYISYLVSWYFDTFFSYLTN